MIDVNRRAFVAGAAAGTLLAPRAVASPGAGDTISALMPFATAYLAAYRGPGMIVGIADRNGRSETASFGFADVEAQRSIRPDERFHIGSISKSFAALMILQLVDEAKVRLDADVRTYLPGLLLSTPYGAVTIHDLLCHAAGLPGEGAPTGWADQHIEQAFAPGSRFHYSNLGYEWLGRVIVAQGQEDWSTALRRRVLDPLDMTQTSPLIGAGMRRWEVPSYVRLEDDRPFPRNGPLTRAAPISFTGASGCIASTARDMNKYIAMVARGGEGPSGRLLSPASFALMVKRHITATEFGPRGGYGYGWMTDEVDGRAVIRHTGGMNSFMSSIHVDLAAGCGAFASINAQQNYRPVPVTAHAVRLCRARIGGAAPIKTPSVDPDAELVIKDYVGEYVRSDGTTVRIVAAGPSLALVAGGKSLPLRSLDDDKFACLDPDYRLFTFLFRRQKPAAEAVGHGPNPVLALDWGPDSYIRRGARAPVVPEPDRVALSPSQLNTYEGLYVADGGWLSSARVIVRGDRLWIDTFDGVTPLASLGADRFRFADETASPDIVMFSPVPGSPHSLAIGGNGLERVGSAFLELK